MIIKNKLWLSHIASFVAFVFTVTSATMFLPRVALAQDYQAQRKIAIFVLPASDGEVEAALLIGRTMRQNAAQLTEVELVTPAPLPDRNAVPLVKSKVDEAYSLLNRRENKRAAELLREVEPLFAQALPGLDLRTVAMYFKAQGVSQALAKQSEKAAKSIEISLAMWPDQSNLEYVYNEEVLKLFGKVQTEMSMRASGELEVKTVPEGAVVIVDEREPMQTPVSVKNLVEGPHLVKVMLDGYEQWAGLVEVKGRGTGTQTVNLKAIPEKATFDKRLVEVSKVMRAPTAKAFPALMELKQFLGTDDLLVLSAGVVGQAYELKGFYLKADGTVVDANRTINRDAEFYASLKEFLSGTFEAFFGLSVKTEGLGGPPIDPEILQKAGVASDSANQLFDPDNPIFPNVEVQKTKKKGLTDQWWFWAGVGVVVITAVAVPVIIMSGDNGGGGPNGTVEIDLNR
jgi:hypothetical protein